MVVRTGLGSICSLSTWTLSVMVTDVFPKNLLRAHMLVSLPLSGSRIL